MRNFFRGWRHRVAIFTLLVLFVLTSSWIRGEPLLRSLMAVSVVILMLEFFVGVVIPPFQKWCDRSALACIQAHAPNVLRYPDYIVPIMWAAGIAFGICAVIVGFCIFYVYSEFGLSRAFPILALLLINLGGAAWIVRQAIVMLLSFSTESFVVTQWGIDFDTLLSGRGTLPWTDVARIRYGLAGPGWIQMVSNDGKVIWISLSLSNISRFASTALAEVNPEAMSHQVVRCLRQIASPYSPDY